MKLILTADVANLGGPGDTVEVKDGYGRNFLLPRGLAIVATRGAEKQVEGIRRAQEARRVRDLDHANEIKQAIEGLGSVSLTGEDRRPLRQAVRLGHPGRRRRRGKSAGGPAVDKRSVELPKAHIKAVGKHTVASGCTPTSPSSSTSRSSPADTGPTRTPTDHVDGPGPVACPTSRCRRAEVGCRLAVRDRRAGEQVDSPADSARTAASTCMTDRVLHARGRLATRRDIFIHRHAHRPYLQLVVQQELSSGSPQVHTTGLNPRSPQVCIIPSSFVPATRP